MAFDLQVFNAQTRDVMTETIDQDIAKFNEASGGAIVLMNKPFEGDFSIEAAFQAIGGLVRRRDAYGSGTLTPKRLKEMLEPTFTEKHDENPISHSNQRWQH